MISFKGKKVLIFGLGLNQGGVGSALFFTKKGALVRVTDLKSKEILEPSLTQLKDFDIEYTLGEHKNQDIEWADLIIKNPGVKPGNPYIQHAIDLGKQVEQDMGIFLQSVKPSQIIGVTGTKGKSTTSSLIYEILKSAGRNVILAGNIGSSVLDSLDQITEETLIVLELSSFQLESFDNHKVSPKWALITNIFPDHLNYYKNMSEYTLAKKVITQYQTSSDFLFLKKDDPVTAQPDFLKDIKSKIIYFSKKDLPSNFKPEILGEHNLENIAAAYEVAKLFNVDSSLLLKSLTQFKGVPFRMELIKEWNGFKIYNDTTATNPTATVQALKTLGLDTILICGGMNKGMDYQRMGEETEKWADAVYFLDGDCVDDIIHSIKDQSIIEGRFDNLESLLTKLKKDIETNSYFKKGGNILFSPGATSFNMFQNEFDRGRKFNEEVEKIFK